MSASVGHFVEVMTGGAVITDKLIARRDRKVGDAIAAMKAEIDRLTAAGMRSPQLDASYDALVNARNAANAQPDNVAISAALQALKATARTSAAAAGPQVDTLLAAVATHAQKAGAALTAVNQADVAIRQIQDPALLTRFQSALSGLQNRRLTHATEDDADQIAAASAGLDSVTTDAQLLTNAAGNAAAQVNAQAQARATKLAAVDRTMTGLRQACGSITEPTMRAAATQVANALAVRRDALANATGAQMATEINNATALLADIATATTRATDAARTVAARAAKLVEVDQALSGLRTATTAITAPAPQAEAAQVLTGLTARRSALANAAGAQITTELGNAPALLADIATATTRARAVGVRAAKLVEIDQGLSGLRTAASTITDPVLQAEATQTLTGLTGRRNALANVPFAQIATALRDIQPLLADIATAATEATARAKAAADKTAKLGEINTALEGLTKANAKIVDNPLKQAAGKTLNRLTAGRDALAQAGSAQVSAELAKAPALLAEIATAVATSGQYAEWGELKPERQMILGACQAYLPLGKKRGLVWLEQGATQLQKDLNKLENQALADPAGAIAGFTAVRAAYVTLKQRFQQQVLAGPLVKKSDDLAQSDPAGPEARMHDALGKPLFDERLLEAWNTAIAFGSPLTNKLSPGEAVAVFTYTSDDYTKINGTILGYYTPADAEEARKIAIMTEEAKKAIAKLDDYVGETRRGDRPFPPDDDAQYTLHNQFTIRAFWSTGVGFAFPGKWQVTIKGKKGKDVATMSNFPKESEVLFPPGTKFKVTWRDDTDAPSTVRVWVEEV